MISAVYLYRLFLHEFDQQEQNLKWLPIQDRSRLSYRLTMAIYFKTESKKYKFLHKAASNKYSVS